MWTDDKINVQVDYELDVNHEPLADCKIRMDIVRKKSGEFSVPAIKKSFGKVPCIAGFRFPAHTFFLFVSETLGNQTQSLF